jgi:hypothetical protein
MTAVRASVSIDNDPAGAFLRWCEGQDIASLARSAAGACVTLGIDPNV